MKRHAPTSAAGEGKARKLVKVGPNGKARVAPMPERAPVGMVRPRAPAERHSLPTLASRRSGAVRGVGACYSCAALGEVRLYEAVDVGKVLLCGPCADKARAETFGRAEPLDHAIMVGGFETNRRRH
ncbi:hypothetical protein [Polyangium mundeleinium]|uniref:Uncharacterized protein n=1 Tax=Polyangium mundeleinium TaxID=2995306 RepID=A0ABT5ELS4_9BACT|nr:hypothetical protein [Polyangium mundeleinium]MDC0741685.1 hypothetical protein [Polyangium mundeleinium]